MTDILLGLIWVHTFCKGYQQMILTGKGKNKHVNYEETDIIEQVKQIFLA